ncbi:hypothetical protein TYRP_013223 [Tyrophagus putrescentiae]|nr:hypothetical protein TYRP_013223 [Tyrophagus putrescentiae]
MEELLLNGSTLEQIAVLQFSPRWSNHCSSFAYFNNSTTNATIAQHSLKDHWTAVSTETLSTAHAKRTNEI